MTSIFDHPAFAASLFMPRRDDAPPPPLARDHLVEVAPGVQLQVRAHERPGTVATLLLFHGNGESAASYDALADSFARAGADLVVAEFRGYGQSTGAPSLRACLADAAPVLAAVRRVARHRALVVMGRSLGGACAAELCKQRGAFAGLVLESAPADLLGALRRRGLQVEALPEADLEDFCPLRKLSHFRGHALVLHGAEDTLVPAGEAQLAFDALTAAQRELVQIPARGHNNVADHPRYWEALGGLIARVVAATTVAPVAPFEAAPTWCAGRRETPQPVSLRAGRLEAALFSSRGIHYKDFNEDAAVVYGDADTVYAAVFDQAGGLGGQVRGEGSEVAARAVSEAFARLAGGAEDAAAALVAGLREAHDRLRARGQREVSTAVALVARGEDVTVANLGDSGAILLAADGSVLQRTERHRFQTLQGHGDLTFALGRSDWRAPDVVRWTLDEGAWILVGTDGFLDNLGGDTARALPQAPSAAELVAALVTRALDAMTKDPQRGDNLSVVALRVAASNHARSSS